MRFVLHHGLYNLSIMHVSFKHKCGNTRHSELNHNPTVFTTVPSIMCSHTSLNLCTACWAPLITLHFVASRVGGEDRGNETAYPPTKSTRSSRRQSTSNDISNADSLAKCYIFFHGFFFSRIQGLKQNPRKFRGSTYVWQP